VTQPNRQDHTQAVMSDVDPDAVYLTEGSGRVVFINRDLDVVYKVAKSEQGLYQNTQEYACAQKYPKVVPTVHDTCTIKNQAHVILIVDVAYDYDHYIEQSIQDLYHFIEMQMPHASISSVQDMREVLAVYPITNMHPSDPKRLYLTQLQEYVEGTDETHINDGEMVDILESELIVLLEESYPYEPFQHIIAANEINLQNIGFKALPDGTFVPQVIDAGIHAIQLAKKEHAKDVQGKD